MWSGETIMRKFNIQLLNGNTVNEECETIAWNYGILALWDGVNNEDIVQKEINLRLINSSSWISVQEIK